MTSRRFRINTPYFRGWKEKMNDRRASWFFFKCEKVIGIKKNDELQFWLKCWNDSA